MNKLVLALGFVGMQFFSFSQTGLEKIIVEKYYVSTTADSIGSIGTLPVGSVTYRVYADMLPGYRFQALYGNSDHPLKINSTKAFFNNEDRGATTANAIASAKLKTNTVALDSWFSVGASATGQFGVLKSEDNGAANLLTLNSLLKNTAASMGIPLTTQDGNMSGSPEAVTFVGFDPTGGIFDATSLVGNSFSTSDGAISALNGATGPTSENRVLLGQFTTNGVFTFELNIQIGTPTPGVSEKYVAKNPINGEFSIPSLILTSNNSPIVAITSPKDGDKIKTNATTTITADATDSDGTIKNVEFFIDGVSKGKDSTLPYSYDYTAVDGTHKLEVVATDNLGAQTTSSPVSITVSSNIPPVISLSAPSIAHIGEKVNLDATATDADGTVKSVEYFMDQVSIGIDSVAPFSMQWTAVIGKHVFKAIAKDDKGEKTTSNDVNIEVVSNIAPVVAIVSPTNSDKAIVTNSDLVIVATASDADGSVKKVEFFVDGKSIGIDSVTPYAATYKAVLGSHIITAVATDNVGTATTSSNVSIEVKNNQLPIVNMTTYPYTYHKNDIVKISANAVDLDGTISDVTFYVDSVQVGVDQTYPYSIDWIGVPGTHILKAVARDNHDASSTSSFITLSISQYALGIDEISTESLIRIFPNPTKDEITIQTFGKQLNKYSIYDEKGMLLFSKNSGSQHEEISLRNYVSGIYFISIETENTTTIEKLIKE
jgi:chitodextrinase